MSIRKLIIVNRCIRRSLLDYTNVRYISSDPKLCDKLVNKTKPKLEWNNALSDAMKIVDYQTSILNLRTLLNDEITNMAVHMSKLKNSTHPLIQTAKSLLSEETDMKTWGLVILLISKISVNIHQVQSIDQYKDTDVLQTQRILAEVTEIIRTSDIIHQAMVNLQHVPDAGNSLPAESDIMFGNKIALLGGDFLLVKAFSELANLRNQNLLELMTTAVRDITESHFIGLRDEQNIPLPSDPLLKAPGNFNEMLNSSDINDNRKPFNIKSAMGFPGSEWELRHTLSAGSLLGKGCQSSFILAEQSEHLQKQAYFFGKYFSLALQSKIDMEYFKTPQLNRLNSSFSLVTAPVLFQLDFNPELYQEIRKGLVSVTNIDYSKIYDEVSQGPGIEKTQQLHDSFKLKSLNELLNFPQSDVRSVLENIVLAL